MNLLLLTSALPTPNTLNLLPNFDLNTIVVRLVALIPLIGGYLLSREGRGNLLWEILAVLLLVLATVVPVEVTYNGLPSLVNSFLSRAPVALLLIGLAFVRDGGWKMIVGLILIIVSGLVLLPH
jgi:hypothetical protein